MVPAENTAASPLFQTAVVPVPSDSGFQFATLVLQVPEGAVPPVPPEPAVLPFKSQKGSLDPEAGGGDVCVAVVVTVAVVIVGVGVVFVAIAGVMFV